MKGWTCPLCSRMFGHRDQQHSCHPSNVTKALAALRPALKPIVNEPLDFIDQLPQVRVEHASGSFMVKAPATFCSIRPRARDVQVTLMLAEETTEFPIAKTLRLSRNRVAHALFLDGPEGPDPQLQRWLRTAHALSIARSKAKGRTRPAK